MAGINVVSASHSALAQNGTAIAGYITAEPIILSTTPAGAAYQWALSKPTASTDRCKLSDDTASAPTLVPDVAGYYIITATVDGVTTYDVTVSVTQVAEATLVEALRVQPKSDASIPAPPLGAALYWSSDQNALTIKLPNGSLATINTTPV